MTTPSQASIEVAFQNDESMKIIAAQTAKDLDAGIYDVSAFVEKLGFALTSTVVEQRVNGTKLLSAVLALLSTEALSDLQLEYLITFYADRLKDHHNVIPAVIDGINALVRMRNLPGACVPKILQSFFQHTTCQSQVRSDRAKLYAIFKYLTEEYKAELVSMGGDFLYGLINSIDGERDPRNLDFIFSFMPDFIANYPLLHLAEDMFEIFACYFPIDFNPNKNDPETITREYLAPKLANCLVASPKFAESTVVLAIEKLDSDLIVAKLDSLELLHQSTLKFTPDILEPYFEQIWVALKAEIFPGTDNTELTSAALRVLSTLLERASSVPNISHFYQTTILGVVLPHLSDINQRLFNPATAIALVCVSGDAAFAGDKILNSFLLKLKSKSDGGVSVNDAELQIKIFNLLARVFKIIDLRGAYDKISKDIAVQIQVDAIAALRLVEQDNFDTQHLDLQRAALNVLNESVPIINETNRALLYKALFQLVSHDSIDLDFTQLIIQLGALYPIELQTHFIDICIRNFTLFSNNIKSKIFRNLLPLVPQVAFAQRVLDLIMNYVFKPELASDVRLIALQALNTLLLQQQREFIVELQQNGNIVHKLIELANQQGPLELAVLEQVASALSRIEQQLDIAEQYAIVTEYLPGLNLQLTPHLYIAKGLLGYLHKDISLDDHFERLLNDLTQLSLNSDNEQLRQLAHQLLCSLVNKIEQNDANRATLNKTVVALEHAIKSGDKKAVEVLAWVAKGLVVCGCDDAADIIEALSALLDHPTLYTTATLAFEIISAEYPELHLPVVKYLYKQKFFHTILKKLGQKLAAFCEHHVNAFIYVLKATPHNVLKMNIEQLGPILFKSLEATHSHTLCIALQICENFVKQKDDFFRGHLNHLIPSCLALAKYKKSMQVRIAALNLLNDITKYPTYVLLAHKVDVVLELAATLDDPKRLVRNVAVTTRNAWYLLGSPGGE